MNTSRSNIGRRRFLQASAAGIGAVTVLPRHLLAANPKKEELPPSESLGGALIGCGGRGGGTFGCLGPGVRLVAKCDVKFKKTADDRTIYTDFRKVLERKDIDVVAIATHPGWHALISIAAMEAGKDVVSEKPMCRFISEGRAVADAEKRFGRVFQLEQKGGYRPSKVRKIFESGLLKSCDSVLTVQGGFKVSPCSGRVKYKVGNPPDSLDWDMYCGAAPLRPCQGHRIGGSHRCYWDYEGGGLGDMGHHALHLLAYGFGRDLTSPVEITPYAPPAHPECCGMWSWCELKYADGFTLVLTSGEWGPKYDRLPSGRHTSEKDLLAMLSPEDQKKLETYEPQPVGPFFPEAVRKRVPTGANAERSHRVATIYHLANVSFRCGRPLKFDPVTEQVVGDDEANRLVNQPMRAPWRL